MIKVGEHPHVECSSRGDKRFSAFYARVKFYGNKNIEELYQAAKLFEDGSTGLYWKLAKGRKPVNDEYCRLWYSHLWNYYIWENPHLLQVLKEASGLSDYFGKESSVCQAKELWRVRNES